MKFVIASKKIDVIIGLLQPFKLATESETIMDSFWENEKVRLRLVDEADVDFFAEIIEDTRLRKSQAYGIWLPDSANMAADMVTYALEQDNAIWFVIMNGRKERLGYIAADWLDERNANAYLEISILTEYRNKGYASAGMELILKYLFLERRFEKVSANVLQDNAAGIRFLEKTGFSAEGLRTHMYYMHGKYTGEYHYSLLKQEYQEGINVKPQAAFDVRFCENAQKLKRGYFWQLGDICLRAMRREDYEQNNSALYYDTPSRIYYESDVGLPRALNELTESQQQHINFGGGDGRLEFAIEKIVETEKIYVGNINICGIDYKNGTFSYSICILPEHRGKGYAIKALLLILDYCFGELRLNKFNSRVNADNPASIALMNSVGCRPEGVLRRHAYYHGSFVDVVLFGLTGEEFYRINKEWGKTADEKQSIR